MHRTCITRQSSCCKLHIILDELTEEVVGDLAKALCISGFRDCQVGLAVDISLR